MAKANSIVLSSDAKVLVILTGSLGDIARALAVISFLKKQNPRLQIDWLTDSRWQNFLELFRDQLNEIIILDRKHSVKSYLKLLLTLPSKKYDLVLDLQRILKSGILSYSTRAQYRLGFYPADCKEFNHKFNNYYIAEFGEQKSKQLQYLEFLKVLGLQTESLKDFQALKNLKQNNKYTTEHADYICLILSSSWESKDWPIQNYLELINILQQETSFKIVLLGDAKAVALRDEILNFSKNSDLFDYVNKTNLVEMTHILAGAKFVISPDSGPAHVCTLVGTPVITLFGPTAVERTAPYQYRHLAISANTECSPCYKRKCPGLGKVCMRLLTAQDVFQLLKLELASIK